MTQTAVQWLEDRYRPKGYITAEEFEQAKEMEKKQIENAYQAGQDNVDYTASFVDENGLENYYQKTYGGNNAE